MALLVILVYLVTTIAKQAIQKQKAQKTKKVITVPNARGGRSEIKLSDNSELGLIILLI
jgi:hypothetical protein